MDKNKKAVAKEIMQKYGKKLEINGVEPTLKLHKEKVILSNQKELSSDDLVKLLARCQFFLKNPKEMTLTWWEKAANNLVGIIFGLFIMNTLVFFLENIELIPWLSKWSGLFIVTVLLAGKIFYFMDEGVISEKRKKELTEILGEDSNFVIAALYNYWGEKKMLMKEREILGKATVVQDKIYLVGGLTILEQDLKSFLERNKWIPKE